MVSVLYLYKDGVKMNNLQINNVVDNKLNVLRKNTFKRAVIVSAATMVGSGLTMMGNGNIMDATIVGSSVLMFSSFGYLYPALSYLSYLEGIKKDLKKGINNYENVSEKNFNLMLKPYMKTFKKND